MRLRQLSKIHKEQIEYHAAFHKGAYELCEYCKVQVHSKCG